jgi:phage gp46-like protein
MSDCALIWNADRCAADLGVKANDLTPDDGLETAVMLSLFTDRRAEDSDVLPDAEPNRRGWWGDAVPVVGGDRFGSRLWLLSRSKQTPDVLGRAEQYAREAVAWLVEDRVAESVDVVAEFVQRGTLGIAITINRPKTDPVQYRFNLAWSAQEVKR